MTRKSLHTSSKTALDLSPALQSLRRHTLFGVTAVLALFIGLGSWMAMASLSGAVVASGKLVVESNVKDVQHPDGGIVGEGAVHAASKAGLQIHAGRSGRGPLLRMSEAAVRARREQKTHRQTTYAHAIPGP